MDVVAVVVERSHPMTHPPFHRLLGWWRCVDMNVVLSCEDPWRMEVEVVDYDSYCCS